MWCVFANYPKRKYKYNYNVYITSTSLFEYTLILCEDYIMCEKVNFNVIEKNKYDNIDDITKYINNIVNKLIVNEFAKSVD